MGTQNPKALQNAAFLLSESIFLSEGVLNLASRKLRSVSTTNDQTEASSVFADSLRFHLENHGILGRKKSTSDNSPSKDGTHKERHS